MNPMMDALMSNTPSRVKGYMVKRPTCPICACVLKRAHSRIPKDGNDERPPNRLPYRGIGYYCVNCRYIESDKEKIGEKKSPEDFNAPLL